MVKEYKSRINLQLAIDEDMRDELKKLAQYYNVSLTTASMIALRILLHIAPKIKAKGVAFRDKEILEVISKSPDLKEVKGGK